MLLMMALATIFSLQAAPAAKATLPDTPQGRHVTAYVKAFNSGDEKTFLASNEEHMTKSVLEHRSAEERGKLFRRMRDDFGTLRIDQVLKATAEQIQISAPTKEGAEGLFTFDFEPSAPYRISGIGIDVKGGER
jgi:hypothetical protein